ncbi:MAG: SGNH/GDSL hydrolase family protein [Verrucomicrobiota bacterium]
MKTIRQLLILLFFVQLAEPASAQVLESKPNDPYFAKFEPRKAPVPAGLILRHGDRLAICGDSITEQKMYSRIMETYLTVCVPELSVTVRQYGWSGETAPGFLARMTNDCLRFHPTVATTCYGMNDHEYRVYEESIGRHYRDVSTAIVRAFKQADARVVLGSPGCVGKKPSWSRDAHATTEALNLNLCELRNIDIEIALAEKLGFADVFWPMLTAGFAAQQKYTPDYAVAGKDGVHPDWAGQLVMAYAFLRALGLDGEIGTYTVDLRTKKAEVSRGHELLSFKDGELAIKSSRYPFCASGGDLTKDNNIRSGMTLVPFNQELNRFMLVIKNPEAKNYKVTWGAESRAYSAEQLGKGVNLAGDFAGNPFSDAFAKVDAAVAAKQSYETRQIKELFHGPEGKADLEATAALTEKARAPLATAIQAAFVPVTHSIRIEAE